MSIRRLARLRADDRGATIVEFAVVAPVALLLIMGLAELSYQGFLQSTLTGAIQKSARDAAIQGGAALGSALDAKVLAAVRAAAPRANFVGPPIRKSYAEFSHMTAEEFIDTPRPSTYANGRYDAGRECFWDVNGNDTWDSDPGSAGQGGANDVTLYEVRISYERLFPVAALLGWSNMKELEASTIIKNQPYATQAAATVEKICP